MDSPSTYSSPFSIEEILNTAYDGFSAAALEVFRFQYNRNLVYRQWVETLGRESYDNALLTNQPIFIPISFFKTHRLLVSDALPEIIFTSSGTTGIQTSSHYVCRLAWYQKSFTKAFQLFYGDPADWAIIGLLPSYLERQGSSLVMMTEALVKASQNADSGLYLYDFTGLQTVLERREAARQKTWLIGVTYALLDFAHQCPMRLEYTVVLETGGMKGRKKEITRLEVQQDLKDAFQLGAVHSEYGMTELLSQAYSTGGGLFRCPPWMKVMVREEDDPLAIKSNGTGALCITDLANMYSCSFIATEDIGTVYPDGTFEILGRLDNSGTRGCSLLTP
ncbi:MAG: acyl transferase [Chitinophagaceae bacterium]